MPPIPLSIHPSQKNRDHNNDLGNHNDHHNHSSSAPSTKTSSSATTTIPLSIAGMHCAGCVANVERALKSVPGVTSADISLADASALIHTSTPVDTRTLIDALAARGYKATPAPSTAPSLAHQRTEIEDRQSRSARQWRTRALVGSALWIILEILHWTSPAHDPAAGASAAAAHESISDPRLWIAFIFSSLAMIFVGGAFLSSAISAARHRSTNMDTLIAIGASAAYCLSLAVLIARILENFSISVPADLAHNVPLYFSEAAGLLALISIGHWLEARTSAAASSAVRELLSLQPDEVTRLESINDSTGRVIPSADVKPGDLILIRPGDRVAVDGHIVAGYSTLDESIVTGESMPVDRADGAAVVAGSLNLTGRLVIAAAVDGYHTTIARIADLVRAAQASRTHIQQLADRVCAIFVPAVLIIAAITFLGWTFLGTDQPWMWGLINATTVLVISCPCALGLATPTAIMVGAGAASRRGILIRSASALERAATVRAVMFDKTGTLTLGSSVVVSIDNPSSRPANESARRETIRLAAALAQSSNHPLSRAVVAEAGRLGLDSQIPAATDMHETRGIGISGTINGQRISLVSSRVIPDALAPHTHDEPDDSGSLTRSAVLRDDRELVGFISFRDEPRPDAADLIKSLRKRHVEAHLLTGDRAAVAYALADRIGLPRENVHAELSPDDKLEFVREEAQRVRENGARASDGWRGADASAQPRSVRGGVVMMVGDGINDAAALAMAGASGGVGVAIATGTNNIAIESADIVIPGPRLASIVDLISISRNTLRTIRQNLFMSFVYNAAAIPAAALGVLGLHGPLWAAAAMAVSDLSVIGNSLRLKRDLARTPSTGQQRPS